MWARMSIADRIAALGLVVAAIAMCVSVVALFKPS
jgi:hypothetical protein